MSDGSVPQEPAPADAPTLEGADASPPSEVELYWSKPPATARRDPARPPGGPRRRADAPAAADGFARLWVDLGGGD